MNREHAIEVATDTLMKRYKGIRKVLLRADAKAVVNRLVYLEDARIAELTAEVERMASWIVRHGQRVTDHACAECLPDGEILIHGFRCGWHTAIARNELKDGL